MRLLLLAGCCALLAFAATNVLASAGVILHWRRTRPTWTRLSASSLLRLRCLAATISTATAGLIVLPSFLVHEPRASVEAIGLPLALGAALGFVIFASGLVRGLLAWLRTRSAVRAYMRSAKRVTLPGWSGPAWVVDGSAGVCVVGLWRPALLVSRGVLASCTPRELSGIVAHERAHVAALDNWKKLLVRCVPDVLAWTPVARVLDCARDARSEEEADVEALRSDRTLGVEIAGALVKVARSRSGAALPLATPFGAEGPISRRVRRLLNDAQPQPDRRSAWTGLWAAVLAPALLCAAFPELSRRVHDAVEAVVQLLT